MAATREAIDAAHQRLDAQSNGHAALDAQDGLFDQVIEDAALEAALDDRERLRVIKAEAVADYTEAHDKAKGLVEALNIAEGDVVRVGRYRIKVTRTESRAVAFETSPSRRISISLLDD